MRKPGGVIQGVSLQTPSEFYSRSRISSRLCAAALRPGEISGPLAPTAVRRPGPMLCRAHDGRRRGEWLSKRLDRGPGRFHPGPNPGKVAPMKKWFALFRKWGPGSDSIPRPSVTKGNRLSPRGQRKSPKVLPNTPNPAPRRLHRKTRNCLSSKQKFDSLQFGRHSSRAAVWAHKPNYMQRALSWPGSRETGGNTRSGSGFRNFSGSPGSRPTGSLNLVPISEGRKKLCPIPTPPTIGRRMFAF